MLVAPLLFKVFREAVLFWVNWKVTDPEERWGAVGFERIDEIFLCWSSFKLLKLLMDWIFLCPVIRIIWLADMLFSLSLKQVFASTVICKFFLPNNPR